MTPVGSREAFAVADPATVATAAVATPAAPVVSFFVPDEADLDRLEALDPDRDWQQMRKGQRWVLQTYLRLRDAGLPVRLVGSLPRDGMLVYHAKQTKQLRPSLNGQPGPLLIGIRGDRKECYLAHFELVQNGYWADDRRRFPVLYWPQPGLIPREAERGNRIERIAFKGFDLNLHPYLFSPEWHEWLAANDLEWVHHSMPHAPSEVHGVNVDWHDYSDVDLVLAFRPPPERLYDRHGYRRKPASKLINAWHAGVPAVIGPDYAFREIRRSNLDYLEATTPEQAREAILTLKAKPDLYHAMIRNGMKRAGEFTTERVTAQWSRLLWETIPAAAGAQRSLSINRLSPALRVPSRIMQRVLEGRLSR